MTTYLGHPSLLFLKIKGLEALHSLWALTTAILSTKDLHSLQILIIQTTMLLCLVLKTPPSIFQTSIQTTIQFPSTKDLNSLQTLNIKTSTLPLSTKDLSSLLITETSTLLLSTKNLSSLLIIKTSTLLQPTKDLSSLLVIK